MQTPGGIEAAGGYGPPPGGGGYGPPPGGAPPGGMPPGGGGYGPPPGGGAPPGGMPPGGGGYGPPPGGAPPGGYGGGPPAGGPAGMQPTVPDPYGGPTLPAGAQPGYGGPAPKKGGKGLLIGGIVGGVLLLVLIAGGLFFFLGGSKKTSVAHEHLPAGCGAVVRVDIKSLLGVDAVKEHVMPVLDKNAKKSKDAGKMARILLAARLDPRKDLTEAVACIGTISLTGSEPDFVAVVGGELVPGALVDALEDHSDSFGKAKDKDGLKVVEHKGDGYMLTQADDGAIIISNSSSWMKKAAEPSEAYKKYELPLKEQFAGVVTDTLLTMLTAFATMMPDAPNVGGVTRVEGTFTLDPGKMGLAAKVGSADEARELRDTINVGLKELKSAGAAAQVPLPDAGDLLNKLKVKSRGDEVLLEADIPKKTVDAMVKDIAKFLEEADEEI